MVIQPDAEVPLLRVRQPVVLTGACRKNDVPVRLVQVAGLDGSVYVGGGDGVADGVEVEECPGKPTDEKSGTCSRDGVDCQRATDFIWTRMAEQVDGPQLGQCTTVQHTGRIPLLSRRELLSGT